MGRELLVNPEQGPAQDTLENQRQAGHTSVSPSPAAASALTAAQPKKPTWRSSLSEKLSADLPKGVHKSTPFKQPKHRLHSDGEAITAGESATGARPQEAPHYSDGSIPANTPEGPIRSEPQAHDPAIRDNEYGVLVSTPGGAAWRSLQAYDPAAPVSGAAVPFRAVHTDFSVHVEILERDGRPGGRWGSPQWTAPAESKEPIAAHVQAGGESLSSCRTALLDSCSEFRNRTSSSGAPLSEGERNAANFHLPGLAWRQDGDANTQQSRSPGAEGSLTQRHDAGRMGAAEASRVRGDGSISGGPQSPLTPHAPVGALSRLSMQGVLGVGGPHHGSIHRSASPRDQEATLGSTRPEGSCCLWRSNRHDCSCLKAAAPPRCASLSPLGPGQTSRVAQVEHSAAALLPEAGAPQPQQLVRSPKPLLAHAWGGHQAQGHYIHPSRPFLPHVADAATLETPMLGMGAARGLHHEHGHVGVPHNSHGWPQSRRLQFRVRHKAVALPEELLLSPAAPLEQHPNAKVLNGFAAMLTVLSSRGKCAVRQKVPFSAVYLATASSYLYGASLPVSTLAKPEASAHPVPVHGPKVVGEERLKVPSTGQIQLILLNPEGTPVHTYVCPYDLSDMPGCSKTFLRQRYIRQHAAAAQQQPRQTSTEQEDGGGNGPCSPGGAGDSLHAGQSTQNAFKAEEKQKVTGASQRLGPGPLEYGLHLRFMCLPAARQSKEHSGHKQRRPRPSLEEPCRLLLFPPPVCLSTVGPSSYPSPSSLASSPASSLDCGSPLSNFSPPTPSLVRFSPVGPLSSPLAAAVASGEAPGPAPGNSDPCDRTAEPVLENSRHDGGGSGDLGTKGKGPKRGSGGGALRYFLHGELRVCFLLRDSAADFDTKGFHSWGIENGGSAVVACSRCA